MKAVNILLGILLIPFFFFALLFIVGLVDISRAYSSTGMAFTIILVFGVPIYSVQYLFMILLAWLGYKLSRKRLPLKLYSIYLLFPIVSLIVFYMLFS